MSEQHKTSRAMVAFAHAVDEAHGLRDAVKRRAAASAGSLVAFVEGVDETYGVRQAVTTKARAVKSRLARGARSRFKRIVRAVTETVKEVAAPPDANAPKIYPIGFKVELVKPGSTIHIPVAPEWRTRPMKAVGLRLYEGAEYFEVIRVECNGQGLLERPVPGEYFIEPRHPLDWEMIVTRNCPLLITVTNMMMQGHGDTIAGVVDFVECEAPKPRRPLPSDRFRFRHMDAPDVLPRSRKPEGS